DPHVRPPVDACVSSIKSSMKQYFDALEMREQQKKKNQSRIMSARREILGEVYGRSYGRS
ncbi:MAG: hypothetical protein II011_09690, partial [Prevotella sp.]|nr:hypothetical protein [Prevotella sp.]MBQ1801007.1 hypothetical protein [Prevotella sp.]